jgi:hypothetical protein
MYVLPEECPSLANQGPPSPLTSRYVMGTRFLL